MINNIQLRNFKSHKETSMDLANLSILCGDNGVGKSSALQALLLVREAYIKDKSFEVLDLKSNPVKIGTANDAIYEFSEMEGFEIDLKTSVGQFQLIYEALEADEKTKTFIRLAQRSQIPPTVNTESLFNTHFQYIGAARSGPQGIYTKDDKIIDIYKQISLIEGRAEYFVHFLDKYRNQEVLKDLCITTTKMQFTDLMSQVIEWERFISDGVSIEIEDLGKLGFVLKYAFAASQSFTKSTRFFEATNVGFGLSYVMPILVAILSAKPGALIIIENPEAHLHPNGIAKLTELFCLAAQAGIQIVLETHSDHVINGILVQSKKFEENGTHGIDRNKVCIYHFDRDMDAHYTKSTKIEVEEGGLIRYPPKGFFDQFSIDRRYLMGF